MNSRLLALLFLFILAAAAPARDWRTTMSESETGWTFGRPGAPLLIEYASFGCPRCGLFSAEAGPAIAEAVKGGSLRFSFRPFLIFGHDRAAAVLARCVPAGHRLGFIDAVMAAQSDTRSLLARAEHSEAGRQRLYDASFAGPEKEAVALAELSGLSALATRHGLSAAAAAGCLANPEHHRWVTEADLAARVAGVTGTPTFEIGGQRLPSDLTPAQLRERLDR